MFTVNVQFERESDKQRFISDMTNAARHALANYHANTIECTGDTLFFTKQPITEVVEAERETLGFPIAEDVIEVTESIPAPVEPLDSTPVTTPVEEIPSAPVDVESTFTTAEFASSGEPSQEVN
jgi:hypothetical protein